ncbi:unnamed protein product [Rotaria sordida]|uniref:Uncharacterized protein n=1 Tax=Rotaria sordida TaxID=392033 RepID=A0A818LFC6_9BILA|nr:unnamed protein product [Rotaria sordida]CAF3571502.1 unnamed protein product [Rotaria sordida]
MDLLRPSLEDLFHFCNRSFTLYTACLSSQIITITIYIKSLTFDEQLDYDYIKRQLRTIIVSNNQKYDYQFD